MDDRRSGGRGEVPPATNPPKSAQDGPREPIMLPRVVPVVTYASDLGAPGTHASDRAEWVDESFSVPMIE